MNLRSAAGGPFARFAHLAGLGRATANTRASEKEDEKDKTDAKAEEEEEDKKPSDDKKDAKAEDDSEKDKAAEDDEDEEDEEKEPEKEASASRSVAAARREERARCAAIFAAPEAAMNIPLAAHLAFETDLPAKAAVGALKAGAAAGAPPGRRGLADRMAGESAPRLGADGGGSAQNRDTPDGNADFILNAGRRPKADRK